MIPISLQLRNFLSYGPKTQTISFDNYHLICLSGKNGHGKSALLDALSWAVWGQARKPLGASRADESLLHLGETHMMVCLDFIANGLTYRIRREFSYHASKSYNYLEFGILDTQSGVIRPLTEKTMRLTQEKITATIGLDYESFINSVFLRQGFSNEFSKKSAKDRKEIFANILGLEKYEELRKKALEKTKAAAHEKDHLARICALITTELQNKPEVVQRLENLSDAAKQLMLEEQKAHQAITQLQAQLQELQQQQQALQVSRYKQERTHHEQQQADQAFCAYVGEWRTLLRQLRKQPSTLVQKKEYEQQLAQLHLQMAEQLTLKQQLAQLKEQEAQLVHTYRYEQADRLHTYLLAYEKQQQQAAQLKDKKEYFEHELAAQEEQLQQLEQDIARIEKEFQTMAAKSKIATLEKNLARQQAFYQKCVGTSRSLKDELRTALQTLENLNAVEDPACPWCLQKVARDACQHLQATFTQKVSLAHHQLQRLHRCMPHLETKITEQQSTLQELREKERHDLLQASTLASYQQQQAVVMKKQEDLRKQLATTQKEYKQAEEQTITLQKLLEKQERAHKEIIIPGHQELKKELDHKELQLKEYDHCAERHAEVQEQLRLLQTEQDDVDAYAKKRAHQQHCWQEIKRLIPLLRKLKQEAHSLDAHLSQLPTLKEQENNVREDLMRHQKEVTESTRRKEQILQEQGALEQKQHDLHKKEEELQKLLQQQSHFEHCYREYTTLATTFSKDGIQALLIEEALPAVEQEANNLLAKLTDNQAHLTIDSLRDLKSGGTKETLDIKISDPLGIRPYEMFSGGEAFRIDFALRIAISKLLAQRAGTSLQTLIIDEGFGSQDEDGLNHIMDALYKIQDDFAKIIIVSHLASMKEQFPVHFVIHKGISGSTVRVVEQA